ncbi:hypothetical protein HCN44_010974 [Aphidius gifuensis]|uniref:Uncharacterized protein n=1 Tax=Aphidius gifuensis TaxID=684658 RepID=A0A834Y8Z5_APHGI|nr:hypothetical protein HCN44_010974 [Aphidius gifuensis]
MADLTDSMARCQSPSASVLSSSSNITSPSKSSITTSLSDDETIKDSDNDSDIISDDECSIDPRKITPRRINDTGGDNNVADLINPMARCQSPSSKSSNIKSSSKSDHHNDNNTLTDDDDDLSTVRQSPSRSLKNPPAKSHRVGIDPGNRYTIGAVIVKSIKDIGNKNLQKRHLLKIKTLLAKCRHYTRQCVMEKLTRKTKEEQKKIYDKFVEIERNEYNNIVYNIQEEYMEKKKKRQDRKKIKQLKVGNPKPISDGKVRNWKLCKQLLENKKNKNKLSTENDNRTSAEKKKILQVLYVDDEDPTIRAWIPAEWLHEVDNETLVFIIKISRIITKANNGVQVIFDDKNVKCTKEDDELHFELIE